MRLPSRFAVTLGLGTLTGRLPSDSGWSPGPLAPALALAPVHPPLRACPRASNLVYIVDKFCK